MTFEVWSHKIAWGERVDCLRELQCLMAWVRVGEQIEEPLEKHKESQESGKGSGTWSQKGLNVAEQQNQKRLEKCKDGARNGVGVG